MDEIGSCLVCRFNIIDLTVIFKHFQEPRNTDDALLVSIDLDSSKTSDEKNDVKEVRPSFTLTTLPSVVIEPEVRNSITPTRSLSTTWILKEPTTKVHKIAQSWFRAKKHMIECSNLNLKRPVKVVDEQISSMVKLNIKICLVSN